MLPGKKKPSSGEGQLLTIERPISLDFKNGYRKTMFVFGSKVFLSNLSSTILEENKMAKIFEKPL